MRHAFLVVAAVLAVAVLPLNADERDPLAHARALYNQRDFEGAVAAAEQARVMPARADRADLIAARAYLERYRESATDDDLNQARERLRRLDPQRFGEHERIEYVVGLGETLFFDGSFGAAADVFDSVLARAELLMPDERERVLDWWASALDRDARPRTEFERQALYQRIRERMKGELGVAPASAAACYWISVAARGQGDLQGAWEAAIAGWVRAPLVSDGGLALRADLDQLVLRALIPERARALGQPPETLREEWERFKERWTKE
ncbi:MAG: hypothetical protein C5B57_07070 [Blastocatellia bacterium]|nr:MAG: hypothetical protein C5B57_07070 [Blastocatellia bacterium]